MICTTCHGYRRYLIHRRTVKDSSVNAYVYFPCPDCGGQGFSYCCEGMDRDLCERGKERVSVD